MRKVPKDKLIVAFTLHNPVSAAVKITCNKSNICKIDEEEDEDE